MSERERKSGCKSKKGGNELSEAELRDFSQDGKKKHN